jgi:hypothetical protein
MRDPEPPCGIASTAVAAATAAEPGRMVRVRIRLGRPAALPAAGC